MSNSFIDTLQAIDGELQQKNEAVYQRLRQAISDGSLGPGTRLVQRELAERMGVSQMPVRDALQRLATEGLVQIAPGVGAVVIHLSTDDIREIILIRGHLEAVATRLSLPFLSRIIYDQLEALVREMEAAVNEDDAVRYGKLNEQFHRVSYSVCPSKRLLKMIDDLWVLGDQEKSKLTLWPAGEQLRESLAEHRHILALLRDGTPDEVEDCVRRHKVAKSNVYPAQRHG